MISAPAILWLTENYRRAQGSAVIRHVERLDHLREKLVLGIVGKLDREQQRGGSTDDLSATLREICGPLAVHATVSRRSRGVAFVECQNSVVAFELRKHAKTLSEKWKPLGIKEVRFS